MRLEQRQHPRHSGQHGDALAANNLNQSGRSQPALKVQFRLKDGGYPQTHRLPVDMAQRQRVQNAQRVHQSFVAKIRLRAVFNGPTLESTLPCVMTMPLGSPVVPEVKRISSGVSAESAATGSASVAGNARLPFLKREERKTWMVTAGVCGCECG